jgi:type II secretory pathway component PulJ
MRLRNWTRNSEGVTLIEQLIALLLGAVIIAALYGFCRAQIYQAMVVEAKTATLEDARGALDIIISDLRNAGAWSNGSTPPETGGVDDPESDADLICNRIYAASGIKLHMQMDLNGNGTCADTNPQENIRYELTGPTSTCGGNKIIRRNGDCLVAHVATPTAGKLFHYYDGSGIDLGDAPPLEAIKRVRIAFAVRAKHPKVSSSDDLVSELSTSVDLRN